MGRGRRGRISAPRMLAARSTRTPPRGCTPPLRHAPRPADARRSFDTHPGMQTHPFDTHPVSRTRGGGAPLRMEGRVAAAPPCGWRDAWRRRAGQTHAWSPPLREGRRGLARLHRFPSEARGRGLEKLDFARARARRASRARARAPRTVIGIFFGIFFSSSNDTQTTYRSRASNVGLSVRRSWVRSLVTSLFLGKLLKSLVLRRGRVIFFNFLFFRDFPFFFVIFCAPQNASFMVE